MNQQQKRPLLAVTLTVLTATAAVGGWRNALAEEHGPEHERYRETDAARIWRGFEIAPVPLELRGKNIALVGLGSYIVNAVGGCNDCHSAGPATQYAPGGNPFFTGSPTTVVNQAVYLGGGRNFGSLLPGTPAIVSGNLTPDKTGRPIGGRSFPEFLEIMRTGADLDHMHPNCSPGVTTNCFPAMQPFNGDLLQIMPWPEYRNWLEHDLRAVYEYLSAVPCVPGIPGDGRNHNECT